MSRFFLHPNAICESDKIGDRTRLWAFSHILPGAQIGEDCNICDGVFVENDVLVGDRVTIKSGVQLWDGVTLEDDVFIGPNVTFSNDGFPRSGIHPEAYERTIIMRGASVGANATILPGLTVGLSAMVGAGSVVTKSVPDFAIVYGNPARIRGYVNSDRANEETGLVVNKVQPQNDGPAGVKVIRLPGAVDLRGALSVCEMESELPFQPERFFLVHDVPSTESRGSHAHKECHQILFCVSGQVRAIVDDGKVRQEFMLNNPSTGLYMPPMVWGTQYEYSADAVLLVLASHPYDANDYIRDYAEFLSLLGI
jgi:acetyltransferase-like isoleucine patch superfamily enzyme/dTDP-4-dehydrorhamnose 3,5-epimerase-like enzyme